MNQQITKNHPKGMSLLELTVVILVLLSLISILAIGARAWRKSSDKSANILNIRNIQQAVRGHENLYGLMQGISPLTSDKIFITETNIGYLKEPKPPAASGVNQYAYLEVVPMYGELYVSNITEIGADYAPAPSSYTDW